MRTRTARRRRDAIAIALMLALGTACRGEPRPASEGPEPATLRAVPRESRPDLVPPQATEGSGQLPQRELSRVPTAPPESAPTPTTEPTSQPETLPQDPTDTAELLDGLKLDLSLMILDPELGRYVVPLENERRAELSLVPALQDHLTAVVRRYDEPAEAVVAIEPQTGRVLAFVEDHNEVVPTEHPAASAAPWAASIFKVVSGAILVEERNLGLGRRMCVPPGYSELEEADLVANEARDTRCVDFTEAMSGSINAYFGRLFVDELTPEVIESWLARFGFNQPIPFELEVDPSVARVPDSRLERARMGAGFRHSHLSPLHGALIIAAVANGGTMMRPTLVDRILDAEGNVLAERQPEVWRRVMHEETSRTLTRALSQTTLTGTAARYFANREGWPADLLVAGKTGTLSNRSPEAPEPNPVLIYSWFTGFAPLEGPRVAVAGLVYNAERWYIKGSYLASEAIIRYLRP